MRQLDSIREYYHTPGDWVLFDQDEVSRGQANRVPRPKAFTLPDGAEIGSQSFAVGWAKRKGDEWYRFQLATDSGFKDIVIDDSSVTPGFLIGEALREGRHFLRVSAMSAEGASLPSRTLTVLLHETACDWPLPPGSNTRQALRNWITNPSCSGLPLCEINSAIQFKFQRKDSPLACCMCKDELEGGCGWTAPHPYCQRVAFTGSRPSYIFCAGRPPFASLRRHTTPPEMPHARNAFSSTLFQRLSLYRQSP